MPKSVALQDSTERTGHRRRLGAPPVCTQDLGRFAVPLAGDLVDLWDLAARPRDAAPRARAAPTVNVAQVSSSHGAVPVMTMFGRKRSISNGSAARSASQSHDASAATSIGAASLNGAGCSKRSKASRESPSACIDHLDQPALAAGEVREPGRSVVAGIHGGYRQPEMRLHGDRIAGRLDVDRPDSRRPQPEGPRGAPRVEPSRGSAADAG